MAVMGKGAADHTQSFRRLSQVGTLDGRIAWLALFAPEARPEAEAWLADYAGRNPDLASLDRVNPKYVLRNWVAESVIRAVEDEGRIDALDRILTILQAPYDEHPGESAFAEPPPEAMRHLCVSCSS
jgi:uncharacterized protein YdiU (UPF0061 family)